MDFFLMYWIEHQGKARKWNQKIAVLALIYGGEIWALAKTEWNDIQMDEVIGNIWREHMRERAGKWVENARYNKA